MAKRKEIEVKLSRNSLLPSAAEMREIEARSVSADRTTSDLMNAAGTQIGNVLNKRFSANYGVENRIIVLCGPGNNGGDGFVVAKRLREEGADPMVVMASTGNSSPELMQQITSYLGMGNELMMFSGEAGENGDPEKLLNRERLIEMLSSAWIVVDALLGIGQDGPPRGDIGAVVECLREAQKIAPTPIQVYSVDVPTGVNADTGELYEPYVQATETITIQAIKRGMCQFPGRMACGDITVIDIDLELAGFSTTFMSLDGDSALVQLPKRPYFSHKGDFGHVLVVGGCPSMPGAPVLVANAAMRSGAGMVTQAIFGGAQASGIIPEILRLPISGAADKESVKLIVEKLKGVSCAVIGPGLGDTQGVLDFISEILPILLAAKMPVVLDADALNVIARLMKAGWSLKLPNAVVTPHPGEMARLLGKTTEAVQKDRFGCAEELRAKLGCVVVLKGASTVVLADEGGFVNLTGNPYMATAGSGDVLSGMIGAFLAQGRTPGAASLGAVFYHGMAGDLAHEATGGPIVASDIISSIGHAMSRKA